MAVGGESPEKRQLDPQIKADVAKKVTDVQRGLSVR